MIEVVHLVWAPLGTAPFARFLDSYRSHDAGVEHRLVLVFKEFGRAQASGEWDALVRTVDHRRVDMPDPVLDLGAYRRVAEHSDATTLCFTNSTARVLADGWLAALAGALEDPATGIAGATGSWESTYSAAPPWLKPLRRRRFAPYPNPHIRTNAFAIRRQLLLQLDWPEVGMRKVRALALENGRRSITAQIGQRGLAAVVVGRDGETWREADWPASATFRSGEQRNLLVADNRTEQYADAAPALRAELERFCWGASTELVT